MSQYLLGRLSMSGRVITVTGGASGIGAATANILAARGAAVIVADINDVEGERVVARILAEGGTASYLHTDVSCEEDVVAMVQCAVTRYGGLHGAFNNAGMASRGIELIKMSLENWQEMIAINLTSVFLCMKHQIAHMLEHGGGVVLNTSSGAGVVGVPGGIDYTAAKHGVVGLTRAAAIDYSAKGVRVNALLPGGVDTPMLNLAMDEDPVVRRSVSEGHPIGRLAKPEELAEAAAWLLSDAASFVTGSAMAVDGGYTCR